MSSFNKEPIDLSKYHPGAVDAIPKGTDISRFKEPVAGRVVAASSRFAVYTLKDMSKLRIVIATPGQASASLTFDKHTAPVKQISFMPGRQNVVASASDSELLVWVIVDGTGPVVSLKYDASKVTGFCWTQSESPSKPANLAIVTSKGELLSVAAGAAFQANMQDESGTLKNAPQKEVVLSGKEIVSVVAKDLKPSAAFPIVAEAYPALVAASDANTAVVVRNGVATRWNPAGDARKDQKIVSICVSHSPRPNTIIIVCTNSFTLWDCSMEVPTKLLDVDVPSVLRVLSASTASTRLVLSVTGEEEQEVKKIQLASVGINTKKGAASNHVHIAGMTLYDLNLDVPFNPSSCYVFTMNDKAEDPSVLLDSGKSLAVHPLPRVLRPRQPQAQQHQDSNANLSVPAPNSTSSGNNNQNLSPAIAQLAGLSIGGSAAATSVPAPRSSLPLFSSNSSVESSADFDKALEPLGNRLSQNANRVRSKASDLSTVLPMDHEQLLSQVLDSQRDNIAKTVAAAVAKELDGRNLGGTNNKSAAGGNVQLDEEASAQISETVVRGVSDGIVENIARGISDSLNMQLARRVDQLVQSAVSKYVKRLKKQQDKDGNRAVEGVASEILAGARSELESKQKEHGQMLLLQLQQLNKPATEALGRLQKIIEQQQKFIDKFTNSGLVEEVERLRAEVATIRAASGGSSVGAISKESILKRARDAFTGGNVDTGLQWVLQQNDPHMTLGLLTGVDEDKLDELIEGSKDSVPSQRWERVLTDLAQIVEPEHLNTTLGLIETIISSTQAGKNPRVADVIRAYLDSWKNGQKSIPADLRNKLRDIAIALPRRQ